MAETPLSDFVHLDPSGQAHVLAALQSLSTNNDPVANIKLLFCEALQATCSSPDSLGSDSKGGSSDSAPRQEDILTHNLNALMLFNAAFGTMRDKANTVLPEEILQDYVFVRAV